MSNPDSSRPYRSNLYACRYQAIDSPVHRLGAGWKLIISCAMAALAIAVRQPWMLCGLLLLNMLYYLLARLSPADFWRDIRFFLIQMVIVIGLYVVRYGISEGLWPGARTSLQILLFFLPGAVFVRTTEGARLMKSLRRIMPANISLALFTSLRFIPFFVREFREIAMAQRLRGAPLAPRQLLNPVNWLYIPGCLLIPLIVRALKTANDAALSAEARGFGGRHRHNPGKGSETYTAQGERNNEIINRH